MQSRKARVIVAFGKLIFARRAKFKVNLKNHVRGANISYLYIVRSISHSQREYIVFTLIIHPIPSFVNKKYQETNIYFKKTK